jgi:hypothetical protein
MSASSLNKCDSAQQILNHKILTDGLKVYMLKIQYVQDINRFQQLLKQGKHFEIFYVFYLAMTQTALNCSRSQRRAAKADKRMVLVHTHGLFIT